jgi:hypothetical protein
MDDRSPPNYSVAEKRIFGMAPTTSVAALAAVALLAAAVLLLTGALIAGLLVLAGGLLLGALFVEQALHNRASRLDKGAAVVVDRSRGLTRFAGAYARAWTGAGGHVTRSRFTTQRLAREKAKLQSALGAAVYAGDDAEAEAVRERMEELDRRIAAATKDARAAVERARRSTRRERLAVAQTQIRKPS